MKNPFYRKPDVIIGQNGKPYMRRWHIIPRNKLLNIYLHQFLHDDEDRAEHNHPWLSLSILLRGKYIEHRPTSFISPLTKAIKPYTSTQIFKRGAVIFRHANYFHRIELFKDNEGKPKPAWTLFITGPKIQEWGFACPKGFRHWKDFVDPSNHGDVGKGCD